VTSACIHRAPHGETREAAADALLQAPARRERSDDTLMRRRRREVLLRRLRPEEPRHVFETGGLWSNTIRIRRSIPWRSRRRSTRATSTARGRFRRDRILPHDDRARELKLMAATYARHPNPYWTT